MDTVNRKRVIIVTDGDSCAKIAIEAAAKNVGARCISRTAGNPTIISGSEFLRHILKAPHDPVVVMVDDKGNIGPGNGESAMAYLLKSEAVNVIGVVAVASNTRDVKGVKVDYSIDKNGDIIEKGVDKDGNAKKKPIVKGDTVDTLNKMFHPVVIGVGDPGKMDGYDSGIYGAPIMTKAMELILQLQKNKTFS